MKKLLFVAVVGALVTFASCSKSSGGVGTYTCVCKMNGTQISSTPLPNVTQAEASTACNASSQPSSGITCALQ